MTYKTEIVELRRQIDRLDGEIIDRIIELTQAIKCLKKSNMDDGCIGFVTANVERLARQKNLDENAVSRIFSEIMLLNSQNGVKPH